LPIQNRDKLRAKLAAIPKAVRSRVKAALGQSAAEISGQQKRLSPTDSGDLQKSIGYTFGTYRPDNANVRGVTSGSSLNDPDLTVTLHAGDRRAWYAALVEFGVAGPWPIKGRFEGATHPGIKRQSFFFPPFRAGKRRAKSRITRAMKQGIKDGAT
jgi:HK97 gp10 family phage protein